MEKKNIVQIARNLSQDFIDWVGKAVSPYHVTHESREILLKNGFKEIFEQDNWSLANGGKYFFTRNRTTLIAFTVGKKFDPNNTGFKIIGAHTDSPCLRLAPLSKLSSCEYIQTHVCTYGGGLWHTWFDRDLSLAGRIVIKDKNGALDQKLFNYEGPLLKIPNLAIHLTPQDERGKFSPNNENHLRPVIAHEIYNQLSGVSYEESNGLQKEHHYAGLLQLISDTIETPKDDIVDLDLYFYDHNKPGFFGLNKEFLSSPRLDNLYSSYFALRSLIDPESNYENSSFINMVTLYDHEEIGSQSFQGADSTFVKTTIDRIYQVLSGNFPKESIQTDSIQKLYLRSFQISADMAHAIHPNYSDKHKSNHRPSMNGGIVLKINHNQRYATDVISASILKVLAEKGGVKLQEFIVKNDSPCGSTIGPISASITGIKTVDVGAPQLGMHSIRETCGVVDAYYYLGLFNTFFREFEQLEHSLFKL